jgi:hypothetical protein
LNGGFLFPLSFATDEVFAESERLSEQHTPGAGNQSLDALHVACARFADLKVFASFDDRQLELAKSVGLCLAPALICLVLPFILHPSSFILFILEK